MDFNYNINNVITQELVFLPSQVHKLLINPFLLLHIYI